MNTINFELKISFYQLKIWNR